MDTKLRRIQFHHHYFQRISTSWIVSISAVHIAKCTACLSKSTISFKMIGTRITFCSSQSNFPHKKRDWLVMLPSARRGLKHSHPQLIVPAIYFNTAWRYQFCVAGFLGKQKDCIFHIINSWALPRAYFLRYAPRKQNRGPHVY